MQPTVHRPYEEQPLNTNLSACFLTRYNESVSVLVLTECVIITVTMFQSFTQVMFFGKRDPERIKWRLVRLVLYVIAPMRSI